MRAPSLLEDAIYRTISWFSLFEYSLTAFEIWKWMDTPPAEASLGAVFSCLETSEWLRAETNRADGFFSHLDGRPIQELVATRHERFLDAMRKMAKVKRATRYFALAPFVRGVFASNTLSWWHTREQSDIDLLIIVEPGTIWTSRFLLVLPFLLVGRRPTEQKDVRDPFCFSFFATTEALDFSHLQLAGGDPYLAYWTQALVPVLDRNIAKRLREENAWATERLGHAPGRSAHAGTVRDIPFRVSDQWPDVASFHVIESVVESLQHRRMPSRIREMMNQDSRVIVNDTMLKFHDTDRREEYRDKFLAYDA